MNFITAETITSSARGCYFTIGLVTKGTLTQTTKFTLNDDGRLQVSGAYVDQSYSYQVPTTDFSITVPDSCGDLTLDPAGPLATGTIVMPANPRDGQGVAISSTQTVAALTLSPNTGQTIKGALTAIAANGYARYLYLAGTATWYRKG